MNAMVLISEEVRNNLLGRRVSGGGNREVRVSQVGDAVPGNGIGEIRVSPLSSENQDDMEQQRAFFSYNSPDLGEWRTWMHGFETGDMVWGKVKSHPWWPGHIFNEAFASSSVRKTKREGHVLVAFFGDSSYGWFEPAELVPFDSHFAEKSKQTTSRNFLKAVEEAMDEVSRRRALGLSCCCRDPSSFRPTSVPGYVAVDVIGHEPNLIYSWKEIKKARDDFIPGEVVASLGQLALAPCGVEHGTIEFAKTFAILSALRKAMFEEFDETYAQAFGVEPVRPSPDARVKDQLPVSSRAAPLSGPLVVAEALGSKRGGGLSRSRASKEQAKKNKYLFKRRDDAPPPPPLPYVDLSPARRFSPPAAEADDGFVLQKRAPPEEPLVAGAIPEVPAIELEPPPDDAPSALEEEKVTLEKEGDAEEEKKPEESPSPSPVPGPVLVSDSGPSPYPSSGPIPVVPPVEEIDVKAISIPVTGDADVPQRKHHDASVSGTVVRKVKRLPHPDGEAHERRRKRKKIEGDGSPSADQTVVAKQLKLSDELKVRKRPVGRPPGVAQSSERGDRGATGMYTPITLPKIELTPQDLEFPLLINDLTMLALDPYHGMERNASLIVRHVFLRFRSLVYQKSLVSPSPGESDAEILSVKPEIAAVTSSPEPIPSQVEVQEQQEPVTASQQEPAVVWKQVPFTVSQQERATVLKQEPVAVSKPQPLPKLVSKAALRGPDDRMRADRKRPPSDRQEEMTIKREKKLKQLKALALEKKKAGGIFQKMQVADTDKAAGRKDGDAKPTSSKISKTEKKPDTRVLSPTYLFMKFPPGTTLPSIASQKVKFGRFGPLDLSAFRVYWKSYTCKMLFKYKADAQSAFLYASNNDMFGQIKVIYSLREFEVPASEPVEAEKQPVEAHADDVQSKLGRNDEPANDPRLSAQRIQQQQSLQLKSCLKKPSGDEPGALNTGTGGLTKESPRVKFMLVGEDGVKEPLMAPGNGGNGDAILPLPPVDSQIKIPRPVNPLPPLLPLPPRHSSMLPRPQFPLPPPPPPPVAVSYDHGAPQSVRAPIYHVLPPERGENRNIDISNQMISLLLRCRDVVNNVNSAVGYVIYHPL